MTTDWKEEIVVHHFKEHAQVAATSLTDLRKQIVLTGNLLTKSLFAGGKVIAFGNGGSATQASHLVGELLGRFGDTRRPLPAIALNADSGVVTCIGNDFGYEMLFERQIEAFVQPGDVAIGFSTSGKSVNVRRGLSNAAHKGAITIALTGAAGLDGDDAQHILKVPSTSTAHIQELHLIVLHLWCFCIDNAVAGLGQGG
jgi:D-sedoheptulose 7-phosphate isomerase